MDSPTDSFDDSPPQMHAFAPTHGSADLPGVHPQPRAGRPAAAFRPPGFPLIHHLLQSGGAARRAGGQLAANLSAHRHLEGRHSEEDGDGDGQVEQGLGEGEGVMEGEDSLLAVRKRHSDAGLVAKWSQDASKGKRMKLESRARDGEAEEGGGRREGGKGGKRREREELKEQLEEARERLQALQERVWRAFGEKRVVEEKSDGGGGGDGGEDEEVGMMDEEDVARGMYDDEDEIDGGEMQKDAFSLLSVSPFGGFRKEGTERQRYGDGGTERGGGGRLHLEDMMEGEGLWLDCGGVVRGDYLGMEDEGDEGGQKFAQALKLELGSAVARVIDRVLRLYTEATDLAPSSPPAAISFLPSDGEGNAGDGEKGAWTGLSARGRGEEEPKGDGEKAAARDGEREERRLQRATDGSSLPPGRPHRTGAPDPAMPLAVQRSPDTQKARPLLGPPLSAHPNLSLHHPSLPRPPSLSHPLLLPPASQPKDPSSSFHPSSTSSSSSSSSFPAPPPPPPPHPLALPLPLLHYSMQQLFSRSLHHPPPPHLPPFRKDYLNCEPFLEFSSHPSFPPLPLLAHLDPALARHAHGGREKERGMRGDGGMRGGMDGGEFYLTAGGISFSRQKGGGRREGRVFVYERVDACVSLTACLMYTPRRACLPAI